MHFFWEINCETSGVISFEFPAMIVGRSLIIFVLLFLSALPEDVIKMAKDVKPVTEIQQNGNDFTITSKTPGKTVTNSFTIGKEAEITTMDGKKLKVEYGFASFHDVELFKKSTEAQSHQRSRSFLNYKK